jgi:hypothetical protein
MLTHSYTFIWKYLQYLARLIYIYWLEPAGQSLILLKMHPVFI